jgi:hypothetical protein
MIQPTKLKTFLGKIVMLFIGLTIGIYAPTRVAIAVCVMCLAFSAYDVFGPGEQVCKWGIEKGASNEQHR